MTVDIGPPYSRKPKHLKQFMKEDKKNRHVVCKLVWLLISLLLLATITFYIYHVVRSTIDDPVEFMMKPLPKGRMLYPPLKFCYGHWIHFVNFTKVMQMNFTKPELIVAASYMAKAYSQHHFDPETVDKSLRDKLTSINLTLSQFFTKVAKNFDAFAFQSFYNHPSIGNMIVEHTMKLEQLSRVALSEHATPYYAMCYIYSENSVKSIVEKFRSISDGKDIVRIDLDSLIPEKTHDMDWLTDNEYVAYTNDFNKRFMALDATYKDNVGANRFISNETTKGRVGASFIVYPDGYSHNDILAARKSTFTIRVKPERVKKQRGCEKGSKLMVMGLLSKNSCNKTCVENRQWISTNQTCAKNHVTQKRTSELSSFFDQEWNDLYSIHQGRIYFLTSNGNDNNLTFTGQFMPTNQMTSNNGSIGLNVEVTYGRHLRNEACEKEKGCEIWSFDVKVENTMLEDVPQVRIEYANEDDVIVTVEQHLLTVENLAKSIGIFVGVWLLLCVSLLFQLFFTCCPNCC